MVSGVSLREHWQLIYEWSPDIFVDVVLLHNIHLLDNGCLPI